MKVIAVILGIIAIGLASNPTLFANDDISGDATVAPGPKEQGNNGKGGNPNNGNNGNDKENGNAQGEKKPKGKGHNE